MHRALQIPELVELAFAQLISAPAYREPDDRSTLARAAGTSRAWMELALARLWNELHNLVPLLRLLGPLEMVKTLHNDDEEPFLYLNEVAFRNPSIKPKAWIRFDYYAKYVRSMRLNLGLEHAYSPAIYEAIVEHRPKTFGLLPNLRTLRFCHDTDTKAGLDPLITLLTPNIRTLSLVIDDEDFPPLFALHIRPRAPFLESLKIWTASEPGPWIKDLSYLKSLELDLSKLTQSLWDVLGCLALVESLQIITTPGDMIAEIPSFVPGSFKHLESLAMTATTSAWRRLLQGGNIPPLLRSIRMDLSNEVEPVTTGELFKFSEAVASAIPRLESFRLSTSWTLEDRHAVTLNDIRPLLKCEHLHTFVTESPAGVNLSRDDIKVVLQAWPYLRRLRIVFHPSSVWYPHSAPNPKMVTPDSPKRSLSLDVLSLFAELCPDIEELAIAASDVPPTPPPPGNYPTLRRLRILDIYQTCVQDVEVTALYLARLIPHEVSLEWKGQTFEEFRLPFRGPWAAALAQWEEVEELSRIIRLRSRNRREPTWSIVKPQPKRGVGPA